MLRKLFPFLLGEFRRTFKVLILLSFRMILKYKEDCSTAKRELSRKEGNTMPDCHYFVF